MLLGSVLVGVVTVTKPVIASDADCGSSRSL